MALVICFEMHFICIILAFSFRNMFQVKQFAGCSLNFSNSTLDFNAHLKEVVYRFHLGKWPLLSYNFFLFQPLRLINNSSTSFICEQVTFSDPFRFKLRILILG